MTDTDWKNIFKPNDFDDFLPFRIKANNSDEQETANSVAMVAEFYFKQQLASTANARFRELVAEHGVTIDLSDYEWSSDSDGGVKPGVYRAILIMEKEIK